jgi:hypothetical protein
MGDESTIRGFQKSEMKLENVRRLTATCALPSTALVEKSTAARERYIQPRLGSQGSKLAVKQICMRSLGGFFCLRGTRAEKTDRQCQTEKEEREEAAEARWRCAVMRVGTTGLSINGA